MSNPEVYFKYDDLKRAIEKNPANVKRLVNRFLVKVQSIVRQGINQGRWRVGMSGGGVPIGTGYAGAGNLKKAHEYTISPFQFKVEVNLNKTQRGKWNYAELVHGTAPNYKAPYGKPSRPWLRYVEKTKEGIILSESQQLADSIVAGLGR